MKVPFCCHPSLLPFFAASIADVRKNDKIKAAALRKRMRLEPLPAWYDQDGTAVKTKDTPNLAVSTRYQQQAAELLLDETALSEERMSPTRSVTCVTYAICRQVPAGSLAPPVCHDVYANTSIV